MSYISPPMKPMVLSVCSAKHEGPQSSARNSYTNAPVEALSREMLTALAPEAVIAWLFCDAYDIFDVAQKLTEAAYSGQLIAMSTPLPNKAMICSEMRAAFPTLRFDLSFTGSISEAVERYQATLESA